MKTGTHTQVPVPMTILPMTILTIWVSVVEYPPWVLHHPEPYHW